MNEKFRRSGDINTSQQNANKKKTLVSKKLTQE